MAEMAYSIDEESFNFDSAEEAIEAMDDPQPGDIIYEGEVAQRKAGYYLPRIDSLLEQMGERAWDDVGEHSPEDWPGAELTDAKAKELEQLLRDWMDANVPVRFWSVVNVKRIDVTAEMIAAARGAASPERREGTEGGGSCRKCGGAMKPGKAMAQTVDCSDEGTCSPAGPGVLIDCMKCERCGWSVTDGTGGNDGSV